MLNLLDGNEIYQKVESLRIKKGWSIYELAKQAGVSSTTIYNWRNRLSSPTLSLLDAVCYAFGITVVEFLLNEDELSALSDEQQEILSLFNTLSYEQKKAVVELMKTMK